MPEIERPFTAFRFSVQIRVDGVASEVCEASFSECDGLEMTMEPKTIREGGNNNRQIHLAGPVSYGQLTLKRGMTSNFDLWDWFEKVLQRGGNGFRADVQVKIMTSDGANVEASYLLTRCLPIKFKVPALTAQDGQIAIEEMQLAYERISLEDRRVPRVEE